MVGAVALGLSSCGSSKSGGSKSDAIDSLDIKIPDKSKTNFTDGDKFPGVLYADYNAMIFGSGVNKEFTDFKNKTETALKVTCDTTYGSGDSGVMTCDGEEMGVKTSVKVTVNGDTPLKANIEQKSKTGKQITYTEYNTADKSYKTRYSIKGAGNDVEGLFEVKLEIQSDTLKEGNLLSMKGYADVQGKLAVFEGVKHNVKTAETVDEYNTTVTLTPSNVKDFPLQKATLIGE